MAERLLWDRFLFQMRESGMIPQGGDILDVGTGTNTTILEMFGDRWNVTPSDINVGEWNSHIPGMVKVDASRMTQEESIAGQKWDAVILSEVLEHVLEPLEVLREAAGILKPGGIVIVSVPFMYRIHEYGDLDPETVEPGLRDYWRFTPSGMAFLMSKAYLNPFWVGRLVRGDKTTFPEFYCPEGIVAWGRLRNILIDGTDAAEKIPENDFAPEIPDNWREIQKAMAQKWSADNGN